MPELPEVETLRRELTPSLVGRVLVDARAFPHPKFLPAIEAVGAQVDDLDRRGKYLLIELDDGRELVVHLGMTGRLSVEADPGASPYERAAWRLDDDRWVVFRDVRRFGRIHVLERGDRSSVATLAALGPEPFDPAFTGAHLHAALGSSRRAVKTQLLSQRPVAGVGNIYADEALWVAGIHPASRRVGRARAERLREAVVEVLRAGIEHGGTTLRDYRRSDGTSGDHQHHLRCYGREGEPCERCGRPLRRTVLDGRGTTWCPGCQRA